MYKETSFDPRCFADFEYYTLLKNSFGHDQGRYIVAPVKDWAREAVKAVKESNIQDIKRKSVITFLNKLQRKQTEELVLLPKDRKAIGYTDWPAWHPQVEQARPFCIKISELIDGCSTSVQLDAANTDWHVPPSMLVNKQAVEIFEKIKPICRLSKEIKIIDQYFTLANNAVLHQIFDFIDKDGSASVEKFTLVTSVNTHNPAGVFANEFSRRYTNKPSFRVIVAPERYFHDRYILSDYASLKTGHGFSEGEEMGRQADRLSFHICSKAERDETNQWLERLIKEQKQLADDQLN